MSGRYSAAQRWMECLLLVVDLGLLLLYLAAWIDAADMCRASLWSFATLKSSPSIAKEQQDQAAPGGVDFSLWYGKRVSAYTEALAGKLSTPLAVLSSPGST